MRKIVHKVFWLWEFEKEEAWLNAMSAKGLQLSSVGLCRYEFEEGTPGEYVYRLELLDNMPGHSQSQQYISFVEETGAQQIGSLFRWVYFRKKAGGNGFDLFSDIQSRINHLNRMLVLAAVLAAADLINGIVQLHSWATYDSFSIVPAVLCITLGLFICYGLVQIVLSRRRLVKEKLLRE